MRKLLILFCICFSCNTYSFDKDPSPEELRQAINNIPQDVIKSIFYSTKNDIKSLRVIAEKGNPISQYLLGDMYSMGRGTKRNYTEAAKWYQLSAEQGHKGAQQRLGFLYYEGNGVAQDYQKAVKWLRLSAKQGDGFAQYSLGLMYYLGYGVTRDYVRSYIWLNLSVSNGEKGGAEELRDKVERFIIPEKIIESQEIAKQCIENNYLNCE
ncbi:MAG: tetratricopeptide repeat protein [Methylobacter sp.]